MPATLKFGKSGTDVSQLVTLLTKHGCAPKGASSPEEFDRNVENMVLYFQMTHQGKDGKWLDVDGVVGPGTWWALENATGEAQRSFLEVGIPKDIQGQRRAILETAVKQHGVREEGAPNRGKEVDKFIPDNQKAPGKEGPAWCCYFASWVVREVMGKDPIGAPVASVHVAWQNAVKLKRWEANVSGHTPIPGDAFIILNDDPEKGWCTGHIGFVLQVAEDGKSINTVEGNCGNRVKIGRRDLSDPKLRGFINVVGDHPKFTRGSLRGAKNVGGHGTR